jgi:hypothetical protein
VIMLVASIRRQWAVGGKQAAEGSMMLATANCLLPTAFWIQVVGRNS